MKQLFAEFFIWWRKQTLGMRVQTWLKGKYVGSDEFGNKYYMHKKTGKRWVIYNGLVEASKIPPGWHAWIHYRTDIAPSDEDYQPHNWQKPHQENLTGTQGAYHPQGSLYKSGQRAKVSADYEAWKPE